MHEVHVYTEVNNVHTIPFGRMRYVSCVLAEQCLQLQHGLVRPWGGSAQFPTSKTSRWTPYGRQTRYCQNTVAGVGVQTGVETFLHGAKV